MKLFKDAILIFSRIRTVCMILLVSWNVLTTVVTSSGVLAVRRVERKTVEWTKLGVFVSKFGKIKVDKNEAFQRCHLNIFQNIDNMYDSICCLKHVDSDYYFVRRFSCASCWAQNGWMGEIGCFCVEIWQNKSWQNWSFPKMSS